MAHQDSSLDVRNNLIYVGFFFYGYDMVRLGKAFGISKQMVSKIINEISDKRLKDKKIKKIYVKRK